MSTILSLFDYSGIWPLYYRYAGYRVVQVDLELGDDIMEWDYTRESNVRGVLAAPPCTHFSGSGAQYWKAKDRDGRTEEHAALVRRTLEIIAYHEPTWWALENPVGRINKVVPELGDPKMYFHPCDFGDPYTKKTVLFGNFNEPEKNPVDPIRSSDQGSWIQRLGGKSAKTKMLRSMTPPGFAKAFWMANP